MRGPIFVSLILSTGLPALSHAGDLDTSSGHCTGAITSVLGDSLSLTCSGDFSLSGGQIDALSKIVISATGSLTLDDVKLSAPIIDLGAGTSLTVGLGTVVSASSSALLDAGDFAQGQFGWQPTGSDASGAVLAISGWNPPVLYTDNNSGNTAALRLAANQPVVLGAGHITLIPLALPEPGGMTPLVLGLGIVGAAAASRRFGAATL